MCRRRKSTKNLYLILIQILVIEGELSTFPRGIMEVTMWMDNDRLHFKSYNEAALKSTVRSQVYIPIEEIELLLDIEGDYRL